MAIFKRTKEVIMSDQDAKTKPVAATTAVNQPLPVVDLAPQTAHAHHERFEKRIGDLRLLFDDHANMKIKVVRGEIDKTVSSLTEAFAEFMRFTRNEIDAQTKKHNEELRAKIGEIEDKASLKIIQKIDEMDKKKRTEIENAKKYAVEKSIGDAINVIDQLEIAIGFGTKDPAFKNYLSGFRMVLDMFLRWLAGFGVTKIAAHPGDPFDEKLMSAVEKIPASYPVNTVADVRKSGYMLHDRVVRHAVVAVSDGTLMKTTTVPIHQPTQEFALPTPQQVIAPTTVLQTKHIPVSSTTEVRHRASPPPPIKK